MKKTLFSFILTFILLITLGTVSAFAADTDFTTAEYTYTSSDGTETVGLEVTAYSGSDTDIYIPSKIGEVSVLKIGDNFLAGNTSVNSVTLGAGIKEIGAGAFSGAANMVCALLNEDVEVIGEDAFSNMPVFNSIILWDSVTSIGEGAFVGCPNLTVYCNEGTASYTFVTSNGIDYEILNPSAVPELVKIDGISYHIANGEAIAIGCDEGLTDVTIVPTVKGFPVTELNNTFYMNSVIESVVLPDTVKVIGDNAFILCYYLNISEWPKNLKYIGAGAFKSCYNLCETLEFPEGVEFIGDSAFRDCDSVKNVVIPGSTDYIGEYAFADLNSLESVIIEPGALREAEDRIFSGCSNLKNVSLASTMTFIPEWMFDCASSLKRIEIPNGVIEIGMGAFYGTGIEEIKIPNSVVKIGYYAFENCDYLSSVTLGDSVEFIGGTAFKNCPLLTEIILPDSLMQICDGCFEDTGIISVRLSSNISKLATGSFAYNTVLIVDENSYAHEFALQNGLLFHIYNESKPTPNLIFDNDILYYIMDEAAYVIGCSDTRTEIVVPSEIEGVPVIKVRGFSFKNKDNITSIVLPDSVTEIGDETFAQCDNLSNIVLPELLTFIGNSAFESCISIKNVNLPEGLVSIGGNAFRYCSSLESIRIPQSVTSLGSNTFFECVNLKSATILAQVSNIPDWMFNHCSALTNVILPESIKSIGGSAFSDCALEKIEIPDSCESMEWYAFYGCDFKELVLPSNLKSIPMGAFGYCENLEKIVFPEGLLSIGESAFVACENLKSIELNNGLKTIGKTAFSGSSIESVLIPQNVTAIGDDFISEDTVMLVTENSYAHSYAVEEGYLYAYASECDAVERIVFDGITYVILNNEATAVSLSDEAMNRKQLIIPESVNGYPVVEVCNLSGKYSTVVLPDTLRTIGRKAFHSANYLKEISIPESVTSVEAYAFKGISAFCDNVSILLPDNITFIGREAFMWANITSIKLPKNLETVEYQGFLYANIKELVVPKTLKMAIDAFVACELETVEFEYGYSSIDDGMFRGNLELTKVTIPETVTHIGAGAFSGCRGLLSVVIPKSVKTFGNDDVKTIFADNTVWYVFEDSAAHSYAVENGFYFELIRETPNPEISYGTSITGTVTYTDGSIAPGVTVEILYDDGEVKESVTTDENGVYSFTYAEVGRYTIRVTDTSGNTASEQVSVKRKNVFDVIVTGETDLVLKKSYNVNVYVEGDAPITVTLSEGEGVSSVITTNNGTVVFENVPNGEYVITAENADGSALQEITVFNKDVDVYLVIEGEFVTLFGKVVVKDRENEIHEREWAQVTVYNSDGVVVASGKTDENGNYSFSKLLVGEYTIKAESTEMREDEYYGYIRPHVLKGYAYADALESGEYEVETIVLTEEESVRVSLAGKVTAQGEHQACEVILMNENRDELARFVTKKNGKYQFDNVRDGYYILCAITEHYGAGFTEITVKNGVVYGETDIRVYKSDRVSAHEAIMLEVAECETAAEAEAYRETVMSEKNFYDSLPDKEKKMFSPWYIAKLDKLVRLLSGYEFTCDGAEVDRGGLIVSKEEVSSGANPRFTISVVEMDKWEKNQNGIETDEDYYQTFVEEAAGDNELAQYYDITLECEKNGKTYEITDVKKHTDTTGRIRLTMPIPDKFKGHKNYAFVHVHNGVPTTLVDLDDDPDTITFEIDRFSTFALMFNDEEQVDLSDYAILSVSENTLTATSTTDATLFVATYNAQGKMTDVKLTTLYADTHVEVNVTIGQKAFVLDADMAPLCEEIVVG